MVSRKVEAARGRKSARSGRTEARIEWFINDVQNRVDLTLEQRVEVAMQYLWTTVVKNISIPVVKEVIGNRTRVTERSKPGEFPRSDTTHLREDIASEVVKTVKGFEGYIITPLDYGLILETRLDRRFLRRTLEEEIPQLERILGAKIT